MLRRYWLAVVMAGVLLTTGQVESKHQVIIWDRTPPQTSTFTAGTLAIALERGGGDTSPGPLFYGTSFEGQTPDGRPGLLPAGLMAPGDNLHRVLIIRNTGSLDATITRVHAELTDGSIALAQKLQVVMTTDAAGTQQVAWGSLSDFIDRAQFLVPTGLALNRGEELTLHIWIRLPRETGNAYQGLRAVVSFGVTAEQKGHSTPPPPKQPPQLG
jgi:hypothetical protein